MHDVVPFGLAIAVVSLAALLAVLSNRVSERVPHPGAGDLPGRRGGRL